MRSTARCRSRTRIVTGGWTGARWGELTGLDRDNLHLYDDTGSSHLDPGPG
jgi:hypothetical protein